MSEDTYCDCGRGHVERWYSFGYYAGQMCADCAYEKFRDHCGQPERCHCDRCDALRDLADKSDQATATMLRAVAEEHTRSGQGDPTTLAEFEAGGWDAIEGDY